ncbi:MAG TPA: hypothetical protein VJ553_02410 [Candidatus Paceibacterota bacterium]|nr:hypothetical protein [Candidatus Paceibacterota bacterium]
MIDFVLALCIALVAIALIEWLKKPFPKVSTWVWWGIAPLLCIGLGFVATLLALGAMLGLTGFAIATLFYDLVLQWAKRKIEGTSSPPAG